MKTIAVIDLKAFYSFVECVDRGLDPLGVNLVVADPERTEKTICLAVSPSLKAYGIPGRARLFEVVQKVKEINAIRKQYEEAHDEVGMDLIDNVLYDIRLARYFDDNRLVSFDAAVEKSKERYGGK